MASSEFLRARDFLIRHRLDYQTAYEGFRWPRLVEFNWALDYFDALAAGNQQPALLLVDERQSVSMFTFAALSAESNRVANLLRRCGIGRGDRILVMLGNEPALWQVMLGAFKLGAVVAPATTLLSGADLQDRLDRGGIRAVVTAAGQAAGFDRLRGPFLRFVAGPTAGGWTGLDEANGESVSFTADAPTSVCDPLLLYFTSGTTAQPKLVEHSHASYPVGHLTTMYWLGLQPGDLHWNISTPGWAKHAWSCLFAPWNAGASVFAYNYARFQARDVLDTLVRHEITSLCAPPTVWRMLIQESLGDYPVKLRSATSAGEPLNAEVIARVRDAWGLEIRDGYGQTETTCLVANPPGLPVRPGSMGRPMPGYRIALLGPDRQQSADGEISVALSNQPVGILRAYSGDAQRTAEACLDGFYRTGDLATRDGDGYLTYVGRADDVFKASDYRLSPFELESALLEFPAIAEAAVVPSPDAVRAAVAKAYIVLVAGYEPTPQLAREIFAFVLKRLSPYKWIRRIEFAPLPKTVSGKIRRAELRLREERTRQRPDSEFRLEDFPGLRRA
ncbi:MAG: AMP-binding protein [Bryobacterales bacterium]|nr:AMP-binding protein [Bryobacterales bacterium]